MNRGHSVPRCNFGHQLLDLLDTRRAGTRSICCGSIRQSTMFFRLRGDAGTETKGAAYGSGLQYMSWNGWLGRMAQSRCRKVVDTASRPVSTQ